MIERWFPRVGDVLRCLHSDYWSSMSADTFPTTWIKDEIIIVMSEPIIYVHGLRQLRVARLGKDIRIIEWSKASQVEMFGFGVIFEKIDINAL